QTFWFEVGQWSALLDGSGQVVDLIPRRPYHRDPEVVQEQSIGFPQRVVSAHAGHIGRAGHTQPRCARHRSQSRRGGILLQQHQVTAGARVVLVGAVRPGHDAPLSSAGHRRPWGATAPPYVRSVTVSLLYASSVVTLSDLSGGGDDTGAPRGHHRDVAWLGVLRIRSGASRWWVRIARSMITDSSRENPAPKQRRTPPPNGNHVPLAGPEPRNRSGRKRFGSGWWAGSACTKEIEGITVCPFGMRISPIWMSLVRRRATSEITGCSRMASLTTASRYLSSPSSAAWAALSNAAGSRTSSCSAHASAVAVVSCPA